MNRTRRAGLAALGSTALARCLDADDETEPDAMDEPPVGFPARRATCSSV